MTALTVSGPLSLQVRLPNVVRYLESKWVDEFFRSGALRLSSYAQFRKHADEQRGDVHEGKALLQMDFGGQPFSGIAQFGSDAYVLCGSAIESLDLMAQFAPADSYFRIVNTVGFAQAVASKLSSFKFGVQGFCMYRPHRTVRKTIQGPPLFDPEEVKKDPTAAFHRMNQRVFDATNYEPFFDKPVSYSHQAEYRLVWCVGQRADVALDLVCPEARQFCEQVPHAVA